MQPNAEPRGLARRGPAPGGTAPLAQKRYYTPTEVCAALRIKRSVLDYWARKFPEVAPQRRNARLFLTAAQLASVLDLHALVTGEGMTLAGALRVLSARGGARIPRVPEAPGATEQAALCVELRAELQALVGMLADER